MNDYNKNDFYTYFDNKTGEKKYFMKINGDMIEVNKSVYLVCHNSYQKQLRDIRRDIKNGLISYDMKLDNDKSLLDTLTSDCLQPSALNSYYFTLNEIIQTLNKTDRNIIQNLFFLGKSEREVADELNICQQALNKRKF